MNKIKVVVCRLGQPPVAEEMGSRLEDMQKMVGGLIECVVLDEDDEGNGVDLWCNEEFLLHGFARNRLVNGRLTIHGDFFIAGHNAEGDTVSLTDGQVESWLVRANSWHAYVKES